MSTGPESASSSSGIIDSNSTVASATSHHVVGVANGIMNTTTLSSLITLSANTTTLGTTATALNSTMSLEDGQNNDLSRLFALPKMDNLTDIFSICCSTAVIFGGLVPYIPQYLKIKNSHSSDGFSTYVCLTLLVANITRIMFWFGHNFETPLLLQSFVIIMGMLAMMEICVRVRDKSPSIMISAIGGSGANRRRRSLIGKLGNENGHDICESLPIYSVLQNDHPPPAANQLGPSTSQRQDDLRLSYQQSSCVSDSTQHSISGNNSAGFGGGPAKMQISPSDTRYESPVFSYESLSQQCRASFEPAHGSSTSLGARRAPSKCVNLRHFWDWDELLPYLEFLALFTFVLSLVTYLLLDSYLYIESIGFVSLFTEAMLGMPQLFRNHAKRSTRGMSVEMVAMWLSGDLFKTLYFFIRKAPVQFYICGSIQVIVDVLILVQVFCYRRPDVAYRKLQPKTT